MNKIGIVIQREYKTRVMKRSFILLTFLTPLLLIAIMFVPMWLANINDDTVKNIIVIDQTGEYSDVFLSDDSYTFTYTSQQLDEVQQHSEKSKNGELSAILYITEDLNNNPNAATLYSEKQIDVKLKEFITRQLDEYVEHQNLAKLNIPEIEQKIAAAKANIDIATIKWDKEGNQTEGSAELSLVIGMITAFLIYIFIVVYGAQVMSGVVQEKTNRIVEVIISSIKPFELMMGKIIGIALVGLTQFFLWIALTFVIGSIVSSFFALDLESMQTMATMNGMGEGATMQMATNNTENASKIFSLIAQFDFIQTIILFIIYFLGGYLLYASLFAAIGSAVDNETDTQQFSMPITLPIFFAIYAAIYSAQNPDGPLAFWCSMIPFTSPIVMMVRLPFDVPIWQLALSIAILIASFIGTTWLAAKIYRIGILMYGKKISWKEMAKWLRY